MDKGFIVVLIRINMEKLVDCVRSSILPLDGKLVDVPCSYKEECLVRVPRQIFNSNVRKGYRSYGRYIFGQVRDKFLDKEFVNGAYISGSGFIYSSRESFAKASEDY